MRLHSVCYYRSRSDEWSDKWRNEDYGAMNLVKAVKGLTFGGSSSISQAGKHYTITNDPSGRATALMIAARAMAGKIHSAGYKSASLVPVPASMHTDPDGAFTGRRLAERVQAVEASFASAPVLYFNEAMPTARAGGGARNPHTIQPHLRLSRIPPAPAVLIDDVCTSGGHLIAAARFLKQHGVDVQDAFVIGRTRWARPESMWSVETEKLQVETLFDF